MIPGYAFPFTDFGVPGASKGHGSRSNRSSSQSASSMLNGMMLKLLHSSIAPSTKAVYRQAYLSYSKFHQTHFSNVPTFPINSPASFSLPVTFFTFFYSVVGEGQQRDIIYKLYISVVCEGQLRDILYKLSCSVVGEGQHRDINYKLSYSVVGEGQNRDILCKLSY